MESKIIAILMAIFVSLFVSLSIRYYNHYQSVESCKILEQGEVKDFCQAINSSYDGGCLKLPKLDQRLACSQWRF